MCTNTCLKPELYCKSDYYRYLLNDSLALRGFGVERSSANFHRVQRIFFADLTRGVHFCVCVQAVSMDFHAATDCRICGVSGHLIKCCACAILVHVDNTECSKKIKSSLAVAQFLCTDCEFDEVHTHTFTNRHIFKYTHTYSHSQVKDKQAEQSVLEKPQGMLENEENAWMFQDFQGSRVNVFEVQTQI